MNFEFSHKEHNFSHGLGGKINISINLFRIFLTSYPASEPPPRVESIEQNESPVQQIKTVLQKKEELGILQNIPKTEIGYQKRIPKDADPLQNLSSLLLKIFLEQEFSEADVSKLSFLEREILSLIVQRKYGREFDFSNSSSESIENSLRMLAGDSHPKRPDECYKYAYIRILRRLRLRHTFPPNLGVNEIDKSLPALYSVPEVIETDSSKSVEPKERENSRESKHKPMSFLQFTQFHQSEIFASIFPQLCTEVAEIEAPKEISSKLKSLLSKYEKEAAIYSKKSEKELLCSSEYKLFRKKLRNYLSKNKQCKFPWRLSDVKSSLVYLEDYLEKKKKKCILQNSKAVLPS